jgi:hypothetical protein
LDARLQSGNVNEMDGCHFDVVNVNDNNSHVKTPCWFVHSVKNEPTEHIVESRNSKQSINEMRFKLSSDSLIKREMFGEIEDEEIGE